MSDRFYRGLLLALPLSLLLWAAAIWLVLWVIR